ncbi:MAG: ZIP family metal transporter [Burkholderiales bacterium]|nr:ZIP family metal transporter [Burkholderiales bacterium]
MSVLSWIVTMSTVGGLASLLLAGSFALSLRPAWLPMLVSYAVGALLGAAFLEILPEAFRLTKNPGMMTATILFGILLFFILEKLVLWRHCHAEDCEAHESHDHGRSGLMIMIGNTFHNFVDGILIAAAFMSDIHLGIVTAIAIIAHEIPQEVGDFMILLHSGYTKRQAILFNLSASGATLIGSVLAYTILQSMHGIVPSLLALAASSMIYVSVADLIPGLHKRTEIHATIQQVFLISLGIGSILIAGLLAE